MKKNALKRGNNLLMQDGISHLWWGSEVDDALQLNPPSELLHQEAVPVLVDRPLCTVNGVQLKKAQGKDVSDRKQKMHQCNQCRETCYVEMLKCLQHF